MNPIQKHPNITELFACNRKMLVIVFLFPINSLISSVLLQNKAIQCVPTSAYSSRFITYDPSFTFLGKLFYEKTPLNLGSF